jgi:2-polyprenyl-6-methoxyphenol hydroxylase-like FAD-dependent oxidoreductase
MIQNDRVLIVGGGPIGAVTGLRLAMHGIPVTVFDRLPKPAEDHRAATLQPSTLDLFEEIGLTETIVRQGLRSPIFQWRDRVTQKVVAEFDYSVLSKESDHPYVIQLEQHRTVYIALDAAARFSEFTMVRPAEVREVRQNSDVVEAVVEREDGSVEIHRGRYLIGCDGGRSIVRKAIGVSFEGFTWPERFNIIGVPFDFEAAMGFRLRNYCAHPDRWVSLMKVPGEDYKGLWRCLFPAKPEESDEQVMSDEWMQARFAECLPNGSPYEIIHRNMYSVHQRVAGNFRVGRIVLAGDAAHVNNPIGGMGMNSGFQDGLNLADKLAQIWQGAEPDTLLDRYDRQRRLTAIEYVQAQSIANKRTLEERDPAKRWQNLENLRRIANDPKQHYEFVRRNSLIAMLESAEAIA